MKENHMKNGQLKPAYNIQIGIEGEYIVIIDVSSERWGKLTFIPFLDKLEKDLLKKFENVIADTGYESEENDYYICASAKKLVPLFTKIKISESGYKSNVTIYESENCNECPYKTKYTKRKGNISLYVSKDFMKNRKISLKISRLKKENY